MAKLKIASNTKRMLSEMEAADYLGLAAATLRRKRCIGEGPAYHKYGRAHSSRVVYSLVDLDGWLARCRIDPEAA